MSKQGNPRIRYMLTEAVHTHVMHCEDSRLTAFFRRKKEEKGSKKATIATDKKLLEVMYTMIVRREVLHAHRPRPLSLTRVEERSQLIAVRPVRKDDELVIMRR